MKHATAAWLGLGAALVVAAEFVVIGLAPTMAADLQLSPSQAGWLVTLFALASALLGPPLVAATARFPPGRVMAAALLPFAASLVLLVFPGFAAAAILRLLQGAALPLFMSLAAARLATLYGSGNGVALLYVGVTLGGTIAPPLGTFSAEQFGWAAPMGAIGGFSLVAAAGCLLVRPGGRAETPRRSAAAMPRPRCGRTCFCRLCCSPPCSADSAMSR